MFSLLTGKGVLLESKQGRQLSTDSKNFMFWIPFFAGTFDWSESKNAERLLIEKFWAESLSAIYDDLPNEDIEESFSPDFDGLVNEENRTLNVPRKSFLKRYRHKVYDLLYEKKKDRSFITDNEKLIYLQYEIEMLTMHFSEESMYATCPSIMNMVTCDGKPTAKEFLRGFYHMDKCPAGRMIFTDRVSWDELPDEDKKNYHSVLSASDKSLLLMFGEHTLECLLVNTLCYMFNMENLVSLASLIDRIESAVRQQAKMIRENRGIAIEEVSEDLEDKKSKKSKSFPFGTALVEFLEKRGLIRFTHHYTDEIHTAESTEGIPKTFVKRVSKKNQSYYRSSFVYAECTFNTALLPVKFNLPMVFPPTKWKISSPKNESNGMINISDIFGGYLTKPSGQISSQRTMSSPDPKSFSIYFSNLENANQFSKTISQLQQVAFQINDYLLHDIQKNRSFFERCGFLLPEFLSHVIVSKATGILRTYYDRVEYKEIRSLYRFSELVNILMKNMQRARYECTVLDLASAYSGYRIYFPAFIDFRGRIYRSGILHFHERDLARSLLLIDYNVLDYPLGLLEVKAKSVNYYIRRYATSTAFLFHSFSSEIDCGSKLVETVYKVCNSQKTLEDVKDQIGHIAMSCKRPLQFYSNCLLYALYVKENAPSWEELCFTVPITLDASASAYQLMAYFLLDETMAVKTNLFDTEGSINDIYSYIREKLVKFLEVSLQKENAPLCAILDRIINRKIVKKIFMPMIYGKTLNSTSKDLITSLSQDVLAKECFILSSLCFKFWKEHFHSKDALINLCRLLGRICSSLERPVLYSTPLFTTSQDYKVMQSCSVRVYDTKAKKRRSVTLSFPSNERDKKKSRGSTFVNFIHQKDAEIAMFVVDYSKKWDIPLYTVHDNFISNTLYSTRLTDAYLEAFKALGPPLRVINRFIYINLIEPEIENVDREKKTHYGTYFSLEFFDNKVIPKSILDDFLSTIPMSEAKNRSGWNKIIDLFKKSYFDYCKSVCGPKMDFREHALRWDKFKSKLVGRYCLHH